MEGGRRLCENSCGGFFGTKATQNLCSKCYYFKFLREGQVIKKSLQESEPSIKLELLVDKETNRVLMAESKPDFVDILFSFLTLPMGSIVRILRKESPRAFSCMRNLYDSVNNLDERYLRSKSCKNALLYPRSSLAVHCSKLKVKLDNMWRYERPDQLVKHSGEADDGGVFVKGRPKTYLITDNLEVSDCGTEDNMKMLLKIEYSNFECRSVGIGFQEALHLLHWSLLSSTPLTNMILAKGDALKATKIEQRGTIQFLKGSETIDEVRKISIKLVIRKVNNMVLHAEAREDFIDLLFNFLTFPLGSIVKLLHGNLSMECIDNLYKSIESLNADNCIKVKENKPVLEFPNLVQNLGHEKLLLGLEEGIMQFGGNTYGRYLTTENGVASNSGSVTTNEQRLTLMKSLACQTTIEGGFNNGPTTFRVRDSLIVEPYLPESYPSDYIEERNVSVGAVEALNLLKASLVSQNPLNSVFNS